MRKILAILVLFILGGFYMILPTYPKIDENKSVYDIKNFVDSIVKYNSNYYIKTARISQKRPDKYINETDTFLKEYKSCNDDKECIVSRYNEYMKEWTHFQLEKETKQKYTIDKFGYKVGKALYETFSFLY